MKLKVNIFLFLSYLLIESNSSRSANLSGNESQRNIEIVNDSGHRIGIYWMPANGGDPVEQEASPLVSGAKASLVSYATHTFRVEELPHKRTNECKGWNKNCRSTYFTVNGSQNQVVYIRKGFIADHVDDKVLAFREATKLVQTCQEKYSEEEDKSMTKELFQCMKDTLKQKLMEDSNEIDSQVKVRQKMSDAWNDYICTDSKTQNTTSPAVKEEIWQNHEVKRNIQILYETKSINVYYVEDFISKEECMELEQKYTSNEDDITMFLSPRKGLSQIDSILRRIFAFFSKYIQKSLSNENKFSLYYLKLSRRVDGSLSHIINSKSQTPIKNGVAMLQCSPEEVEGYNFRNIGIHVKPRQYSALIFHTSNLKHDLDLTELSECSSEASESHAPEKNVSGKRKVGLFTLSL